MVGGMEVEDMPVKPEPAPLETMVKHMSNGLTDWVDMNEELDGVVARHQEFPQLHAALLECLDRCGSPAPQQPAAAAQGGGPKKSNKEKKGDDKRVGPQTTIANSGRRGRRKSPKSQAAKARLAEEEAEQSPFNKALIGWSGRQTQPQAEPPPSPREAMEGVI